MVIKINVILFFQSLKSPYNILYMAHICYLGEISQAVLCMVSPETNFVTGTAQNLLNKMNNLSHHPKLV